MAAAEDQRPGRRVALVTGASSGIGAATARILAREHATTPILIARREERLRALAEELGGGATNLAVDLVDDGAPARAAAHVREHHGRLDLLVNNAGASWRGSFSESGWDGLRRHMELNFDAVARLTEVLLPILRESAPSAIVNVSSTAARVSRGRTGAYSASKAALAAWSDGLYLEERPHDVHVGVVLPGFVATEGFPQGELPNLIVSNPETAARAIVDAGLNGRAERYVPRPYWLVAALRVIAPGLVRRVLAAGAGGRLTTTTGPDSQTD